MMNSLRAKLEDEGHLTDVAALLEDYAMAARASGCQYWMRELEQAAAHSVAHDKLGTLGRTRSLGHTRSHTITWDPKPSLKISISSLEHLDVFRFPE